MTGSRRTQRAVAKSGRERGSATPTFAELAAEVVDGAERAGLAPNTLRGYRSALRHHLLPRFGELPIAALGPEDLAELIDALRARGLTENGILDVMKPLRRALDLAASRDLLDSNPYDSLDGDARPRPSSGDHRILSVEEIDELSRAADGSTGVAIGLALFCGLRNAEARELRARDLEPDQPAIVVRRPVAAKGRRGPAGEEPNGISRRLVDGLGDAFGFLRALCDDAAARDLEPDAHLVRSPTGRHFDRGNFSRRYGLVVARAGLAGQDERPLTFEQLRNNFAVLGARIGAGPIELLRQLGKSHTASLQSHVVHFDEPRLSAPERTRLRAAARRLATARGDQ